MQTQFFIRRLANIWQHRTDPRRLYKYREHLIAVAAAAAAAVTATAVAAITRCCNQPLPGRVVHRGFDQEWFHPLDACHAMHLQTST